jgi:hypothetical protein
MQKSVQLMLGGLLALTGCENGEFGSYPSDVTTTQSAALSADGDSDVSELAAGVRGRCPRDLPAALNPPADATVTAVLPARGVQIYTCATPAAGGDPVWTLKAPHAVLVKEGEVQAIHFAGPSWQALDGSTVVGARVASATPDATDIPWLLLAAASNAGEGLFANVTAIQRLNTVDGLAPSTGCDAAHLNAQVLSRYRADYFFYHTAGANERVRQCAAK